jgi:hypothetical protein
MVDLVVSKGEALSALCRDSHVQEPAGLQAALTVLHSEERNPGAAAELLAKLLHMLAEVQVCRWCVEGSVGCLCGSGAEARAGAGAAPA